MGDDVLEVTMETSTGGHVAGCQNTAVSDGDDQTATDVAVNETVRSSEDEISEEIENLPNDAGFEEFTTGMKQCSSAVFSVGGTCSQPQYNVLERMKIALDTAAGAMTKTAPGNAETDATATDARSEDAIRSCVAASQDAVVPDVVADCSATDISTNAITASSSQNCFTDSSDIEVIAEEKYSSDSIEVLDSHAGRRSSNEIPAGQCFRPDIVPAMQQLNFFERVPDSSPNETVVAAGTGDQPPVSNRETACDGGTVADEISGCEQYKFNFRASDVSQRRRASKSDIEPTTAVAHTPSLVDVCAGSRGGDLASRPDSLALGVKPRGVDSGEGEDRRPAYRSRGAAQTEVDAALHTHGVVTRDGDMIAFVAQDLNDMIKMSSPKTRYEDSCAAAGWSGSQTPMSTSFGSMTSSASGWSVSASSASGWSYSAMSRSPSELTQSPDDMPPIDANIIHELEIQALRVAGSLQHMTSALTTNLHRVSALSCLCLETYQMGVDNTCDCVDASIKAMYTLMAKSEELAKAMEPIYKLREQVKEINRLLDVFQTQMSNAEK